MINFITSATEEFQKVEWPSKNTAFRLTIYVIGVSLFVGLFTAGVDYLFKELLALIVN